MLESKNEVSRNFMGQNPSSGSEVKGVESELFRVTERRRVRKQKCSGGAAVRSTAAS